MPLSFRSWHQPESAQLGGKRTSIGCFAFFDLSRGGAGLVAARPRDSFRLARHRERHRLSLSGEDMVRRVDQLDQHFGFAERSEHLAVQHGCNCLALHGPVSHRRGSSKGRR